MKRTIILLFTCLFSFTLFAQQPDSKKQIRFHISKEQMYEDFDEFVSIFQIYNAQWAIRAEITGYNILEELQKKRNDISNIRGYWQFIDFMYGNLYTLLDDHSSMREIYYNPPHPRYAPGQSFYDSVGIQSIALGLDKYYKKKMAKFNYDDMLFGLNTKYIDGQYYMAMKWTLINPKTKDTVVLQNARIIAFDYQPIDQYVRNHLVGEVPTHLIGWDFHFHKYYAHNLMLPLSKTLKVENEDGKFIELIPNDYSVKLFDIVDKTLNDEYKYYKSKEKEFKRDIIVDYFPSNKVLYIYLHQMSEQEGFNLQDSIRHKACNNEISKIIIDVRDNVGGGDGFWYELLSFIIKDTISIKDQVALNWNPQVAAYLNAEFPPQMSRQFKVIDVPFLSNRQMLVRCNQMDIEPDSLSIGFDGPIYILQDEKTYSAAHSFASIAKQVDQLTSVGTGSGNMVGFGLNPWGFKLKHSKFAFQFEPAVDLSAASTIEDTYQCSPEIEIVPTLKEINTYEDWKWKIPLEEFLFTKDYLFLST